MNTLNIQADTPASKLPFDAEDAAAMSRLRKLILDGMASGAGRPWAEFRAEMLDKYGNAAAKCADSKRAAFDETKSA